MWSGFPNSENRDCGFLRLVVAGIGPGAAEFLFDGGAWFLEVGFGSLTPTAFFDLARGEAGLTVEAVLSLSRTEPESDVRPVTAGLAGRAPDRLREARPTAWPRSRAPVLNRESSSRPDPRGLFVLGFPGF